MGNNEWSISFGIIGLLVAYALHLWAVANGHELLAILTWWYCAINLAVYAVVILGLLVVAAIFILASIAAIVVVSPINRKKKKR